MGTASEGSDGGGIVGDCGVGTIVWVRRRNGSWWPGRILGLEELAESHVMSSRSGTPVKLLGREDASVDWYNLEKSKRVKPFRCGEFDACIERAEASHSTPIKKREKYARREDAILHALELEKQHLEMQQESTAISYHAGNKSLCLSQRESNQCSSEVHLSSILANQAPQTSSVKISSLLDECHLDHPLPIHKNRNVKTSISKDEKHENATQFSVEDASPDVVKSKGKLLLSVAGGNSDITDDDHCDLLPHGGHNSGFSSQAVIDKNLSVFKRKTLQPGAISDSPAKRRDRRRPLVKVLQNTTKLPVSCSFRHHHDGSGNPKPAEEHLISITHDAQKNTTMHSSPNADDSLDYSSRSSKHTPADSGNADLLQLPGCISTESTPSGWTEENDYDSSATDSEFEMVEEKLRSGITQPLTKTAESSIERGMSHWHLRGKRNNRIISKRLHEYADGKNKGGTNKPNRTFRETSPEGKASTSYDIGKFDSAIVPAAAPEFSSEKEIDYDTEEEEIFTGLGNKRDDLERHHSDYIDSDDDQQLISEPGWGTMRPFQLWKPYWEEEPEDNLDQFYTPSFSYRMIPMLVDVDLKVQARYQGEHVPLVSLMSKLNGMAIVGHPVHIEVLEDGSTDALLPNEFEDSAAPPIWRTAKRTSMHRPPRSNPDPLNNSYLDSKTQSDLPALLAKKKRFYHTHRSASGRFQRKPLKTVSLSSSQKTRALSSFVSEKKKINSGSVFAGGLINADRSMPLVTCIPAKVVFSRILESIARPSVATVAHRAIAAGAAERGSS